MKKILSVFFVLGAILLTQNVWAEHGGAGQCPMGGDKACAKSSCDEAASSCPIVEKALKKACFYLENWEEIGLSQEQVQTIKDLKLWFKKQMVRGNADMQIMMLDMHTKLSEDTFDPEGTKALIDEGMVNMVKSAKESVDAYAKLKTVLTPEQVEKAKEIWKKK